MSTSTVTDAESREPRAESFLWEGHDAGALAIRCGVERLELFDVTDSTLDAAHALAEAGATSGTVVLADAQRAGRGRMGRAWSSEPGRGVWCTVVERSLDLPALDVLSIRVGLEVAERLDTSAGETVGIKWPNDLMLGTTKLGGILVETRWSGTSLAWAAVGVGVNVSTPVGLARAARLPKGARRPDVLVAVVAGVRAAAVRTGHLTAEELSRFRARDALRGRRIVEPHEGTVSGIEANGALVVETRRGAKRVRTGTIRMAEGL